MAQAYTLTAPTAATEPAVNPHGRALAPGTVLDERYLVERVLGAGGMGYVVAARHLELAQSVAIKLVLPQKMNANGRARLVREARTVARFRSDHVVRVFDVVNSGPHAPYIVMQHLDGETLSERVKRKGALEGLEVVEVLLQSCEAIGEAHLLGVVHRDLKPSNLFLVVQPGSAPSVKVLDFGISKTADADAERLTHSHALLASPAYASPEQLRTSHDVDHRADIWSLGVIAYECLTGNLPFRGASLPDICAHILHEAPVPIRQLRPDVHPALERVVLRCLEKDSAHRYGSIQELVLALRQFAPGSARKCLAYLRGLEDPDAFNSSRPLTPSSRSRPNVPTRRLVWVSAAALVLGGLGAGAAYYARAHGAGPPSHGAIGAPPDSTRASARSPTAPPSTIAPLATAAVTSLITVVPVDDEAVPAPPPSPPPLSVRAARPRVPTPAPPPPTARARASSDTPWVESR